MAPKIDLKIINKSIFEILNYFPIILMKLLFLTNISCKF